MRLIDADALRQTMESNLYWGLGSDGAIMDTIDEAPTVEAVEVVRCRDCRHWVSNDEGLHWCDYAMEGRCTNPDNYCSYGERRSGHAQT